MSGQCTMISIVLERLEWSKYHSPTVMMISSHVTVDYVLISVTGIF